ncbi:MAG: protein-export membrane protein SecF [Candidatus Lambdaproteobacteria bacterium RIFOXYD2_FULL_50_16]|uniref:Protein-export membrane protein SecF n=1 Tax=Candidatus Lambdaproteobacteria bacterium RIFOXYD2_FULL_50_16 TaxID=1817772 RepID=A0A1F6G563_9PROT|nr:MAG: protein-export membrane protein SecF [Candidatus Lambdaproteobacteria bacterium RIFOXYD2_FULL_50_16]
MKFFKDLPQFDIMGKRTLCYVLSAVFMLASIGLFFTKGINYGIDFKGGTLVQVRFLSPPELGLIRNLFSSATNKEVAITSFGDQINNEILITLPQDVFGQKANMSEEVTKVFGDSLKGHEIRRIETVGGKVGDELKEKAMYAGIFALIGILAYVGVRFKFQYGLAAVAALFHDVIITIGFFILADKEFSLTIVAAVLTIIGYSLNDTIVVFDRIRENVAKLPKTKLLTIINRSINESLSRTILTSLTTFLVVVALFIFGGEMIHDFCYTMMVGLIVGTYSSIFVASPIVWMMDSKRKD